MEAQRSHEEAPRLAATAAQRLHARAARTRHPRSARRRARGRPPTGDAMARPPCAARAAPGEGAGRAS